MTVKEDAGGWGAVKFFFLVRRNIILYVQYMKLLFIVSQHLC